MAKRSLRTKRNFRKVNRKNTKRKIRRSIKKSKQKKRINRKYIKRKNINYRGGGESGFTIGEEPLKPNSKSGFWKGFWNKLSRKKAAAPVAAVAPSLSDDQIIEQQKKQLGIGVTPSDIPTTSLLPPQSRNWQAESDEAPILSGYEINALKKNRAAEKGNDPRMVVRRRHR